MKHCFVLRWNRRKDCLLMKKRYLAVLLVLSLLLGGGIGGRDSLEANARTPDEAQGTVQNRSGDSVYETRDMPTGRIPTQIKELPEEAVREAKAAGKTANGSKSEAEGFSREKSNKASAIYDHEWDKYANYYFYNQLSDKEKEIYDMLDETCRKYMTTYKDAEQTEAGCYLQPVEITKSDWPDGVANKAEAWERISEIVEIFRESNPQYYFLDTSTWGSARDGVVALGIYRIFALGEERESETDKVQTQLNKWEKQIKEENSEEEKVKLIHDLITKKVTYNYGIDEDENFDDEEAMTQSAYSVICMDETVCMGYSKAFALLCNGADIDAVTVTSPEHAWNKVRVNDSWYNVDCTWDDTDDEGRYDYFERNDMYLDKMDNVRNPMHEEENFWEGMLPVCSLDSNPPDAFTPGTLPAITEKAATPVISFSGSKAILTVTTKNARIYYSLDDTIPTPGSVKCYLYKEAFAVSKGMTITAVAVCDAHLDSEAADYTVEEEMLQTPTAKPQVTQKPTPTAEPQVIQKPIPTVNPAANYKITYKLNGGKNDSENPLSYSSTSADIVLKNPTKKGYTFKGWYEDSGYGKKITRIVGGSSGNKILYAKWQANKYKVVFKKNGGTKGKMPSMTSRKYGKKFRLRANKFKRKGYRFVGWSTKKNGKGKRFVNRQKVKNLTSKANGKVTLYARWKKK